MKKYYSIGEFAKFSNVTIQALRYYDKIDLLKPSYINEENGYRYYEKEQFYTISLIFVLKSLGFSIKEIQNMSLDKDPKNIEKEYIKKREDFKEQIKFLNNKVSYLDKIIDGLEKYNNYSDEPLIERRFIKRRKVMFLKEYFKAREDVYLDKFSSLTHKIENLNLTFLSNGNIIYHNDHKDDGTELIEFFFEISGDADDSNIKYIEEGEYLIIFHKGNYEEKGVSYEKLKNYANKNNIKISDTFIEHHFVGHDLTSEREEFSCEIQVKIIP